MPLRIIPDHWVEKRELREAEQRVYRELSEQLKDRDDYVILHDVSWIGDSRSPRTPDIQLDFVILHPEIGVIVLEVKGGGISKKDNIWYQRNRYGQTSQCKIAPHLQAKDNQYKLREKLKDESKRAFPDFTISWAVCFPDCTTDTSFFDAQLDREVVIDQTDLLDIEAALYRVRDYWVQRNLLFKGSVKSLQAGHIEFVCNTFAQDLEFTSYLGPSLLYEKRVIEHLSEEQWQVFSSVRTQKRLAVFGCAGSGKTLLAQMISRKLAREGYQVLLCCYNQPLRDHLKNSMSDVTDVSVYTIDALRAEMGRSFNIDLYREGDADTELLSRLQATRRWRIYDAIVVDEGQDFSNDWFDLLKYTLKSADTGLMYLFLDDNQRIYDRKFQIPEGFDPKPLTINFRTTQAIHTEIVPFYKGRVVPTALGPDGDAPEFIAYDDGNPRALWVEFRKLLNRLKKEGVNSQDIVVLTPRAVNESALQTVEQEYDLSHEQCNGKIQWDTIRRFKGLERAIVILTEINGYTISSERIDRLLYIAYSRACHRLFVLHDAAIPDSHLRAKHLVRQYDSTAIISGLNNEQKQAVTAEIGRSLVWAGAGTGKTRVLTQRIAFLINVCHASPESIIAVTFTKKATREMQQRLYTYLDTETVEALTIRTFHGMCHDILKEEIPTTKGGVFNGRTGDFRVLDDNESERYCNQIVRRPPFDKLRVRQLLSYIKKHKSKNLDPSECPEPDNDIEKLCNQGYEGYEQLLREHNRIDFSDLINLTLRLLKQDVAVCSRRHRRWLHVLIDEFQDTDTLQFQILRLIHEGHERAVLLDTSAQQVMPERSWFVVGDAQQSIYLFRNADYRIFVEFQDTFTDTKVYQLVRNYRSTRQVIRAALAIAEPKYTGVERLELLATQKVEGPDAEFLSFESVKLEADDIARITANTIARGVKPKDIVVLLRFVRARGGDLGPQRTVDAIRTALIRRSIPTVLVGVQSFYENPVIRALVSYLRVLCNPHDDEDFAAVLESSFARGISIKTIDELKKARIARELPSIWNLLTKERYSLIPPDNIPFDEIMSMPIIHHEDLDVPNIGPDRYIILQNVVRAIRNLRRDVYHVTNFPTFILRVRTLTNFDSIFKNEENEEQFSSLVELFTAIVQEETEKGKSLKDVLDEFALVDEETYQISSTLDAGKVQIMTIHKAKGLEFDTVFIPLMEEGVFPSDMAVTREEILEEGRVCYVALTRAKRQLILTTVKHRVPNQTLEPSVFYNVVRGHIFEKQWIFNPYYRYTKRYSQLPTSGSSYEKIILIDGMTLFCSEGEWQNLEDTISTYPGDFLVIVLTCDDEGNPAFVSTELFVERTDAVHKAIQGVQGANIIW